MSEREEERESEEKRDVYLTLSFLIILFWFHGHEERTKTHWASFYYSLILCF